MTSTTPTVKPVSADELDLLVRGEHGHPVGAVVGVLPAFATPPPAFAAVDSSDKVEA